MSLPDIDRGSKVGCNPNSRPRLAHSSPISVVSTESSLKRKNKGLGIIRRGTLRARPGIWARYGIASGRHPNPYRHVRVRQFPIRSRQFSTGHPRKAHRGANPPPAQRAKKAITMLECPIHRKCGNESIDDAKSAIAFALPAFGLPKHDRPYRRKGCRYPIRKTPHRRILVRRSSV